MSKILTARHNNCVEIENFPNKPKILVLLATYNGALWLEEQLQSIFSQQGVSVHVLIGDDLSKDSTISLLKSKFERNVSIKIERWSTPSGSAGANFRRLYLAADTTHFDFVALADQDDIWLANKLSRAVGCLEKSNAAAYSSAVEAFWPDDRTKILRQSNAIRTADFLFEGAGQGCTFLVRADVFRKIQLFIKKYHDEVEALHYHDWLIYLLVRSWEMNWYFDSQFEMRYRQHEGNEIGSRVGYSAIKKRFFLIRSRWYLRQVQAASLIYRLADGKDNDALRLIELLSENSTIIRRISLFHLVLKRGRRRLTDRIVLAISSIFGWL